MQKNHEAILDSLPAQPPRSRLDPYADLIEEMRRRNWTYRGIAQVLAEKCNLKVAPSNIHHFVRQHELRTRNQRQTGARLSGSAAERTPTSSNQQEPRILPAGGTAQDDEVQKRINALKQRPAPRSTATKAFEFDPSEPLRLKK